MASKLKLDVTKSVAGYEVSLDDGTGGLYRWKADDITLTIGAVLSGPPLKVNVTELQPGDYFEDADGELWTVAEVQRDLSGAPLKVNVWVEEDTSTLTPDAPMFRFPQTDTVLLHKAAN